MRGEEEVVSDKDEKCKPRGFRTPRPLVLPPTPYPSPFTIHGHLFMAIDPICGMTVDPATAAGSHEHRGQRYYFCGLSCLERFKADPERALQPQLVSSPKPTTRKPLPMMQPAPAVMGDAAIDPVCGMTVQPATAAGSYEYQGKTYYFCATSCLTKFRTDPIHYLTPPEQRVFRVIPTPSGGVVEYICPMDPEVLETQPGACRICGMALEPKVVSLDDERNPELEDMTRRFWVCLGPSLLVMLLAMAEMIPGLSLPHRGRCTPLRPHPQTLASGDRWRAHDQCRQRWQTERR